MSSLNYFLRFSQPSQSVPIAPKPSNANALATSPVLGRLLPPLFLADATFVATLPLPLTT